MTTEMSGAISSLLNLLLKFKNTGEDKKSDSFIDMETEISARFLSLSMYDNLSDYCVKMAEADDTWIFLNIFTDNNMLPCLLLWYGMRFANWNFRVAIAGIKLIAPISHVLDRTSYLRILPRHIADIHCLPQSILHHFQMGGFVVNLTDKPFSSVAFDESHEMLINKDIKAAISRVEPDYLQRICPYLPIRAKIIKKQVSLDKTPKVDDSLTCISAKDTDFEKNVREIHDIALTAQLLPAPITENRGLCNVFTNKPATLQVKEDMFGLVKTGNREMDAFVNSRILNVPSTEPPVQRKKLKIFEP